MNKGFKALDGFGVSNFNLKEVTNMKNCTRKIAALVAVIALVVSVTPAHALRVLTEAEKAQVIAEYLAEREAKEAAKAPEPAPEVKKEDAPASAVVKVEVVQAAETKNDPAVVVKVEEKAAEAKVEAEKAEIKAEAAAPASADVAPKVEPILFVEGSGPAHEGAKEVPSSYAGVTFFDKKPTVRVDGKVETVVDGDVGYVIMPNRGGMATKEAELELKELKLRCVRDGKATFRTLPIPRQDGKAFSFDAFETLQDFLLLRKFGVTVTAVGIQNINEAVRGIPIDRPVRTVMVLENPVLDDCGRISGYRCLYQVGQARPLYVVHEADFDGLAYWVQLRIPKRVAQGVKAMLHHRSAKARKYGYEANDAVKGEPDQCFLTVMFGTEGNEHRVPGQEGRERSIPARDVYPLDAEESLAAARKAAAK